MEGGNLMYVDTHFNIPGNWHHVEIESGAEIEMIFSPQAMIGITEDSTTISDGFDFRLLSFQTLFRCCFSIFKSAS
jgi:hypothetical protein